MTSSMRRGTGSGGGGGCSGCGGLVLLTLAAVFGESGGQIQQKVPESLRIGGLWNSPSDDVMSYTWEYAIATVNDDRSILMRSRLISAPQEQIMPKDSYGASRKVCKLFRTSLSGLVALFGPQAPQNAGHIQSLSEALHIPHIETRWDYSLEKKEFSMNLHPHPSIVGKAFADLIREMNWKSFIIIYEDEESLIRLQEVIKYPKTFASYRISLWQLDPESDDYRPMLKAIAATDERNYVLDCSFDKIGRVLAQADQIGLISVYHKYLITSLDVERVDLFPYKRVDVNITGYRMVDSKTPQALRYLRKWDYLRGESGEGAKGKIHPLYSSNALMYDAVMILSHAMDELASIEGFSLGRLDCDQPMPWMDGRRIMRYIKKSEYIGLTGEFNFDKDGFRTDFKLDLLNKHRDIMKKIGTWTPETGVNLTLTQTEMEEKEIDKIQNKTLRITTWKNPPFVIAKPKPKDVSEESWEREDFLKKFEGYCIDLVYELAKLKTLKFKYEFQLVEDQKYGSFQDGEWNGMIKELRDRKADLAVLDLSITAQRQEAVDFSMPFMSTGVGILYKKKAPAAKNLFSFLLPLDMTVWIYMTTAFLATSILMFLLARISPQEWESPHPCDSDPQEVEYILSVSNSLWFGIGSFLCQGSDILPKIALSEWESPTPWVDDPTEVENTLTLHNCFWHNWGSIMQQGSDIAPKAISTRMVAGMWWFFTLIMISSYTANLAAFLTAAKMEGAINNAEDLAKQTKVKYGTYCCGSTNAFFKGSTLPTIQKLNGFMESAKPSVYTDGNIEGIERVLKEDGGYAFFIEAASMEYHIERKCELMQIGDRLDSKGYGIALPPGSPYTKAISDGILKLQEDGVLAVLYNRWWREKSGGANCEEEGVNSDQLGLPNLGGVFIVLLGGMIASILLAFGEFVWENRLLAFTPGKSLMSEMWKEFKFSIDFREGDSKPLPKENGDSTADSNALLADEEEGDVVSHHTYGVIGDSASNLHKASMDQGGAYSALGSDPGGRRLPTPTTMPRKSSGEVADNMVPPGKV